MATLTVAVAPKRAGLDVSGAVAADAALTDKFTNDQLGSNTMLYVKNAGGGSVVVTFVIPTATVDGQAPTAKTKTITTGKVFIFGPFPAGIYSDTNSFVTITYDQVASVTVLPFLSQ